MTARAKATAHAMYARQRAENVKAIINEHKGRRKMTNADLAKAIGMSVNTLQSRKSNPGRLRLEDIWLIFEALDVPEDQRKTVM